jgi:serine protease Do
MKTNTSLQRFALLLVLVLLLPALALAAPGWLGLSMTDVTSDKVSALKLKEERGVEIVTVMPDSPAAKAGLKEHDVVLEFNGARVDSVEQLQRLVREIPSGRTVNLTISRDGNVQNVQAKLGERSEYHYQMPNGRDFVFRMPDVRIPEIRIPNLPSTGYSVFSLDTTRLGIDVEPLSKQLGEFFGVPEGEGLLVRSVVKDSPAEKAGIKAGDVIVKMDGKKVTDARDIRSLLRDSREKKSFPVVVVRNKKETALTVTVEPPERTRSYSRGERL